MTASAAAAMRIRRARIRPPYRAPGGPGTAAAPPRDARSGASSMMTASQLDGGSPVQIAIDHVNVTVPVGATAEVVAFYVEVLGVEPVERPPGGRHAGAWLQVDADTQLHLSEHAAPPNPQ